MCKKWCSATSVVHQADQQKDVMMPRMPKAPGTIEANKTACWHHIFTYLRLSLSTISGGMRNHRSSHPQQLFTETDLRSCLTSSLTCAPRLGPLEFSLQEAPESYLPGWPASRHQPLCYPCWEGHIPAQELQLLWIFCAISPWLMGPGCLSSYGDVDFGFCFSPRMLPKHMMQMEN